MAAHDIDILITGIGLTATTYSLTRQLHLKRPDYVIQAGVGGCFISSFSLGSVVAIKQEVIADLGVMEKGMMKSLTDLQLMKTNQFPYSKGWLKNKGESLKKVNLKKVTAVSVNEITTSAKRIGLYQQLFNPVVESMEGAALHYVCLTEKIPFLQLRALSNYVGQRNKKKWNMKESITHLNQELVKLLTISNPI